MNIKTKFDIGQKAWMIRGVGPPLGKRIVVAGQVKIDAIMINCGINVNIDYDTLEKGEASEAYLFLTRKEAQAECDRRNKR